MALTKKLPILKFSWLHTTVELGNKEFLVALNAKSFLSLWSKWQIGHRKWFLNTNLFLIKHSLLPSLMNKIRVTKELVVNWFCIGSRAHSYIYLHHFSKGIPMCACSVCPKQCLLCWWCWKFAPSFLICFASFLEFWIFLGLRNKVYQTMCL